MKAPLPYLLSCSLALAACLPLAAAPVLLDDQFELPKGFHIYRAAEPGLTGGSYDLVFDGDGRLLVGDGENVRRLHDADGDGVYDSQQIIATGLGGRGPQGLLVLGDHLYAVGGDGVQLYSGYRGGGILTHERRLGAPFNTGGDHAAHTLLRGIDGWIYLVTGDGGGTGGRKHITEDSSPVLNERAASVFRFSPDGSKWECVGAGGRNPPSLGMNYLGELFSFDSDMEWHVDLPFYRPVRLNHWATGADLGWQGVGAFPPYYIDTIPGVLDVGRGSPDWGVFYEHEQFPENYHDAFICCDYRWKSATSGGYDRSGRLVSFHLKRSAATWQAEMSLLAQAKPGAKDDQGRAINFGLVDVDVAPDGSICVTDHSQGVWRIFYDERANPEVPPIVPKFDKVAITNMLKIPQPAAEWSRLRIEQARAEQPDFDRVLVAAAQDTKLPARLRLRAIRLLAPLYADIGRAEIAAWAKDDDAEVRGQAAWLIGIRGDERELPLALAMLGDDDPFVRRRAAEALGRFGDPRATQELIARMGDNDRHVSYAAMIALAHLPSKEFLAGALRFDNTSIKMRALVAAHVRGEPFDADTVKFVVGWMLEREDGVAGQLDRLRILGLFRNQVQTDAALTGKAHKFLLAGLDTDERDLRWEHVRLLGEYNVGEAFGALLKALENEKDGVTQFHIATALAGISTGWTEAEGARLAKWLASTQTGWFAELEGKGRQFGGFWATTLNRLATTHAASLAGVIDEIVPGSPLAAIALKGMNSRPDADKRVIEAYREATTDAARLQLLDIMTTISRPSIGKFLLEEQQAKISNPALQKKLLAALAAQPLDAAQVGQIFLGALLRSDDPELIALAAGRLRTDGRPLSAYPATVKAAQIDGRDGERAVCFRLLELLSRDALRAGVVEAALATLTGQGRPGGGREPAVIWSSNKQIDNDQLWFAREFELPGEPASGQLLITCDNEFTAFINGEKVAASADWQKPLRVDVGAALRAKKNVIAVHGVNHGGPAGLIALLKWQTKDGRSGALPTDSSWRMTERPSESWQVDGTSDGAAWVPSIDVSGPTKNALEAFRSLEPFDASADWVAAQEYWQGWYRAKFGEAFVARPPETAKLMPDDALHALIKDTENFASGDAARGRQIYLNTGCFACHGGLGETGATLFGPALPGVTLRLNRNELADAIVYPSKQVAERFRATALETTDGKTLNGFITENSDSFVSITDLQNNVTRLPRAEVKSIKAQDTSLMPPKLLNALSQKDVLNLMAFLAAMR